jgi:hypothetical protein
METERGEAVDCVFARRKPLIARGAKATIARLRAFSKDWSQFISRDIRAKRPVAPRAEP